MDVIGDLIDEALAEPESQEVQQRVAGKVHALTERFPLYDPLA